MALVIAVGAFVGSIVLAALSSLLVDEIKARTPTIVRKLIAIAVGQLPKSQRERFDEEWRSHTDDVPGPLGKIVTASGFLVAAYRLSWLFEEQRTLQYLLRQVDDMCATSDSIVTLIRRDAVLISQPGLPDVVGTVASATEHIRDKRNDLASLADLPVKRGLLGALRYRTALRRHCRALSRELLDAEEVQTTITEKLRQRGQARPK